MKIINVFPIIIGLLVVLLFIANSAKADQCIDASNLDSGVSVEGTYFSIVEHCEFGCDNVTYSCNPSYLQQNAYFGGIVLVLVALIGFALKH